MFLGENPRSRSRMESKIEVGFKEEVTDPLGNSVKTSIIDFMHLPVKNVRTRKVYFINSELNQQEEKALGDIFTDPIIQTCEPHDNFDWSVLVSYKPGVTDNVGNTSSKALEEILGKKCEVHAATQYLLSGKLKKKDVERIALNLLSNSMIEDAKIQDFEEFRKKRIYPHFSEKIQKEVAVKNYSLDVSNEGLAEMSEKGLWALNLREMNAIRSYFDRKDVIEQRERLGLKNPTDVEMECLAQTWSEHCQHKIFNARIHYRDGEKTEKIDSLFRTFIKKTTEEAQKEKEWLLSVFKDNAGIIRFNDKFSLAYKVETHNSPSALEPRGGAMTGIVGVNRDVMGAGIGAKPLANVWFYCLGNPDSSPRKGILHPRRIREGVHQGVIEGGNQSGIPYARGGELFDDRFGGKPLVFCGTLGIMPNSILGKETYEKNVNVGDLVVMVGGRVGKDGIHGATFSSQELHEDSPVQAVQIGDPITQKKMSDMLIEARDQGLYGCITDNGAGGLSSSIGEMARFTNGAEIDIGDVPLKYRGLQPWEILLSEAQERMTLAVRPEKIYEFLELAGKRDVEATVLGKFTDSGKFHVKYQGKTVAYLDLDFLHSPPRYELEAEWKKREFKEPSFREPKNMESSLKRMLSSPNICSKEEKCRQYDHEVKGRTVVKPFVGKEHDVPSDATVLLAELGGLEGIVMTEAINPFFSEIDAYHMATNVVDEAVRKIIASGGRLDRIAGLDNFCWPRSIPEDSKEYSEKQLQNFKYNLGQLVRANMGLYDATRRFNIPLISGKDSMFNDCTKTNPSISVLPTLLFSAISRIDNVRNAVTLDFKAPGDGIYVLGKTYQELGGSEYYKLRGFVGNKVPTFCMEPTLPAYRALGDAIGKGLLNSAHAVSRGGLAVALAKCSFGGMYGADVNIVKIPMLGIDDRHDELLYSESNSRFVVTVPRAKQKEFEKIMGDCKYAHVGYVRGDNQFKITGFHGKKIIDLDIRDMKKAWKGGI